MDKYGPDLAPITTLNNVNGQTSLAVDSAGKLYVGNEGTTLYVMVIPSGSLVTSLTIPSAGLPSEIVVDGVGNVFVDDGTHNDVVEYLAGATTSSLTIPAATIYFNGGMAVSP